MSLLVILAAAAAAATASPTPNLNSIAAVTPMRCRPPGVTLVERERKRPQLAHRSRPLSEMPPADMHLLVDRKVNGCAVPVIVVKDVESNLTGRPTPPPGAPTVDAPQRRR